MYFDSFEAALTMAGHGAFVWSAYAITMVVLAIILLAPRRRRIRYLRELAGELKRQEKSPNAVNEGD
jgi:heme exporter protein D